ncbi:similar to Saccharomyces cerevisiae YDR016C DAD1 Essential subunit of the Dam1 complex (aka DASH complex) [Maudiozyma barnettii]|uniref:DASH complex subunit DAD1 n=1 Tax=Maudiozyma barnettii TaxID=61262 RepID=A0A8H2VD92_9SACH|nr:Dad1p [Kazachstania barnettii]CAB4253143.1 similar to Saccharomyces cerevisiae YDR016C DAD1 Essential subunit of the Dam1 complex (aka DASH complex) [Kazachstania barnettii]CAD1780321.1 similar to Saccharomyces cerevisiae YDR016C DAD1 Essential subunit of the Dam1 complex (aka DASH complex) [Kazachstania barnettii]
MNDSENTTSKNSGVTGNTNTFQYDASLSSGDRHFIEQRNIILQDVNGTMDSILNGLNELNISLENNIAVGKEFEVVTKLWKNFYNGTDSVTDGSDSEKEDKDVNMD